MSTEIAKPSDPMADFQAKLKDRIRTDIAGLLPDEALQKLVEKAIEDEFFKPLRVPKPNRSYYSEETIEAPSWFRAAIVEAAKPLIQKSVDALLERPEAAARIKEVTDTYLTPTNLTIVAAASIAAVVGRMGSELQDQIMKLVNDVNTLRMPR